MGKKHLCNEWFELEDELVSFFNGMPFSLEGVTDMQAMVIQTFSLKQMKLAFHFLKNNKRFVVHVFT